MPLLWSKAWVRILWLSITCHCLPRIPRRKRCFNKSVHRWMRTVVYGALYLKWEDSYSACLRCQWLDIRGPLWSRWALNTFNEIISVCIRHPLILVLSDLSDSSTLSSTDRGVRADSSHPGYRVFTCTLFLSLDINISQLTWLWKT